MKSLFPDQKNCIYLNSGSHSITPCETLKAVQEFEADYEQNPTAHLFSSWKTLWEVQKKIAPHFGANPQDIFFRTNVTQPLNDFILGLPLPKDAEILTSNHEYGAISNICRYRAERDNLSLKTFALPSKDELKNVTAKNLLDRIVSAWTPQTRLLVLSEIYSGHGLILPTLEICKEARSRGIFTVIDAAHTPGSKPLDFSLFEDVDFYAGNLHKWWMGPKGTAFGWVNPRNQHLLQPISAGWVTFETASPFDQFGDGSRFAQRMLMLGCHDFSPFYALTATLDFWQHQGKEKIWKTLSENGKTLIKEMRNQDFRMLLTEDQATGPLYAFELPKKYQTQLYSGLMWDLLEKTQVQSAITVIENENFLRLSPHIYNTEAEIKEAATRLAKYFHSY